MELNEQEKTIVDLINKLSEVSSDESTTQEAIDRIMDNLRKASAENTKAELEKIENMSEENSRKTEIEKMAEAMRTDILSKKTNLLDGIAPAVEKHCSCGRNHANFPKLVFTRIREVKNPVKAHPTDAGIDFFVPDAKAWTDEFKETVQKYSKNKVVSELDGIEFDGLKFDGSVLEVSPNAHVAIPSGIKTIIPTGLAMMMVNKSGVATKLKLDHSACLIDSEYRDELIFCFFNHNVEPVKIEPGMKITQGLIVPVINLELQEVLNCVYDDMGKGTDRGGGFGSSGSH